MASTLRHAYWRAAMMTASPRWGIIAAIAGIGRAEVFRQGRDDRGHVGARPDPGNERPDVIVGLGGTTRAALAAMATILCGGVRPPGRQRRSRPARRWRRRRRHPGWCLVNRSICGGKHVTSDDVRYPDATGAIHASLVDGQITGSISDNHRERHRADRRRNLLMTCRKATDVNNVSIGLAGTHDQRASPPDATGRRG